MYGECPPVFIDELKNCDNAPVCELDAAGVAFREAGMLWKNNHPKPLMERAVYLNCTTFAKLLYYLNLYLL